MNREQALWAPPPRQSVVDWAKEHAYVPVGDQPGPYNPDVAPHINEILEACTDEEHTEVDIIKSVQSSGSTATHVALGYWVDTDPSDVLIVYPSEPSARDQMDRRVMPFFTSSARLSSLMAPSGTTKAQIALITGRISIAWSGSPSSLASHPYRRVICDETDKYTKWRGQESDPLSLARDRTVTYGSRAKLIAVSTPTVKNGLIYQAWRAAGERRRWWVRCPHCRLLQLFSWERLAWEYRDKTEGHPGLVEPEKRREIADALELGKLRAWWTCLACEHRVDDRGSRGLLSKGQWVSDGRKPGERVDTPKVAYHIWSGMSFFVNWRHSCAEYLRAKAGKPSDWQNFVNNFLGEPFEQALGGLTPEIFENKGKQRKEAIAPTWTRLVIASADVQHDRIWYMVRAWAADYRSRLLTWGQAKGYEDLARRVLRDWTVERTEHQVSTGILLIDVGGTTRVDGELVPKADETLRFAAQHPHIVVPVLGMRRRRHGDARIKISKSSKADVYGVKVHLVDTIYYKDLLAYRLSTPNERDPFEMWEENESIDAQYARHMTSEERVLNDKEEWIWQPKYKNARNDLWDCAVYQCAGADLCEVSLAPDQEEKAKIDDPVARLYEPMPQDDGDDWWDGTSSRW